MIFRFLLIVFCFIFWACSTKQQEKENERETVLIEDAHNEAIENEHFFILFPGKTVYSEDSIPVMEGAVIEHKYIFEKSVAEVYLLSYMERKIPSQEIEKRMYATADEILTYFDVDYKDKKFVATEQGSFFYFTAFNADVYLDFQLVYADGFFYQMGLLAPFAQKINAGYSPFLNSFKLK